MQVAESVVETAQSVVQDAESVVVMFEGPVRIAQRVIGMTESLI